MLLPNGLHRWLKMRFSAVAAPSCAVAAPRILFWSAGHAGFRDRFEWGMELLCSSTSARRESLRHRPNYAGTYLDPGYALKDAGRFDEAAMAWEQAKRLAPNHVGAGQERSRGGPAPGSSANHDWVTVASPESIPRIVAIVA